MSVTVSSCVKSPLWDPLYGCRYCKLFSSFQFAVGTIFHHCNNGLFVTVVLPYLCVRVCVCLKSGQRCDQPPTPTPILCGNEFFPRVFPESPIPYLISFFIPAQHVHGCFLLPCGPEFSPYSPSPVLALSPNQYSKYEEFLSERERTGGN